MSFDMNRCEPGDKLISCHGVVLTYVGIDERLVPFRHKVKYPDGAGVSRADDGSVFLEKKLPTDQDIIGFA